MIQNLGGGHVTPVSITPPLNGPITIKGIPGPGRRFLAARGSGTLPASVTEPGALGRIWAMCPDLETAEKVADALERANPEPRRKWRAIIRFKIQRGCGHQFDVESVHDGSGVQTTEPIPTTCPTCGAVYQYVWPEVIFP